MNATVLPKVRSWLEHQQCSVLASQRRSAIETAFPSVSLFVKCQRASAAS